MNTSKIMRVLLYISSLLNILLMIFILVVFQIYVWFCFMGLILSVVALLLLHSVSRVKKIWYWLFVVVLLFWVLVFVVYAVDSGLIFNLGGYYYRGELILSALFEGLTWNVPILFFGIVAEIIFLRFLLNDKKNNQLEKNNKPSSHQNNQVPPTFQS